MPQITALFLSFENKQNAKMDTFLTTITEQNLEIQKSIEFLSLKYDDVILKMERLERENDSYKNRIETLESKIELLESGSCMSRVQIKNIPKQSTENKNVLMDIVKNIGHTIKKPIMDSDIRDIYRLKSKNVKNNHIVVDFTTLNLKTSVIKNSRIYDRENQNNRLNTSHIGLPGEPCTIYIDEVLTKHTSELYYRTREFVKKHNKYMCWTSYGKIYVKQKNQQDAKVIRIVSEDNLRELLSG